MELRHKISAVMITQDCEDTIAQVLGSLSWCDEIVIVDSGSKDGSLEIMKQFPCHLLHHPFEGYGKQKLYAISLAKNDWILSIDSDEVITPALRDEILNIFSQPAIALSAFRIPRTMVFMGRVFRFGYENKRPHLCLFNRKAGNFNDSKVHEKVEVSGSICTLKNEMLHYSYTSLKHYLEKFNKYTELAAHKMAANNKTVSWLVIWLKLPFNFIIHYILKLNILNGFPGFVWSYLSTAYAFVKYTKLYELNRRKSQSPKT